MERLRHFRRSVLVGSTPREFFVNASDFSSRTARVATHRVDADSRQRINLNVRRCGGTLAWRALQSPLRGHAIFQIAVGDRTDTPVFTDVDPHETGFPRW